MLVFEETEKPEKKLLEPQQLSGRASGLVIIGKSCRFAFSWENSDFLFLNMPVPLTEKIPQSKSFLQVN